MITHVVPPSLPTSFRFAIISSSVRESSDDVGSSHRRTGAPFRIARASETRCFSPPDILRPLSPTTVLYPSGRRIIMSWRRAFLEASTTSSHGASKLP
mmetsp:Transcript_30844/g.69671  ORF Transcript_30844/g.69671 Transcript_30844/m.69671 type:complete len:98 (-) Transcript_30844:736-1029(-)